MIDAIGIPSKGVPYLLEHTIPLYRSWTPPLVVSISAPPAAVAASAASVLGFRTRLIHVERTATHAVPGLEHDDVDALRSQYSCSRQAGQSSAYHDHHG